MTTNDFPQVVAAMTMELEIGHPVLVGSISRGTPLTVVPITGGRLSSHAAFHTTMDFSLSPNGSDFIHYDPSGQHMRLDTRILARSRDARDDMLYVKYKGIIKITRDLSKILSGSVHAKSTEFGSSAIHVEFETGCDRYRSLELAMFVGAGRFVVDEKKGRVSVEYLISQVVSGGSKEHSDMATQTND